MSKKLFGTILFAFTLVAVALIALFSLSPDTARGQIFVTYTFVTNTSTNGIVQNSLVPQTNTQFAFLSARTLQVTNISTNETIIGAYGFIFSGFGFSNAYIATAFTNTFPLSNGWGTNLTWTTNIPAVSVPVSVIPYGIFSNSLGSNAVLFQ